MNDWFEPFDNNLIKIESAKLPKKYKRILKEHSTNHINIGFMLPDGVARQDVVLTVPRLYMGRDPNVLGIQYSNQIIESQEYDALAKTMEYDVLTKIHKEPQSISSFASI